MSPSQPLKRSPLSVSGVARARAHFVRPMVNNPPGDRPEGMARKHRVSASQCFGQPVAAYMSGDIEQRT